MFYSATHGNKFARGTVKKEIIFNKKLAEELHKPITRKLKKRKVYSSFIDNVWGADLNDMQLISKFNKGIRFLLCVIDVFSRYEWIIPLKNKEDTIITNAFQKCLNESNIKPNKISVDKGSEFHNRSMKLWLKKNIIEIYSAHNEGKYVVAEIFIRTLKNKI